MWSLCRVSFESIWVIPNRKLPIVLTNFCPEIYRKFECPRMPLAFASTLGGTLTMIGSAANLLASDCARALEPAVELGFFALSLGWNPWEDNKINDLSPWRPLVKDFLSPWSVACSDLVPKNGEVSYGWVHIFWAWILSIARIQEIQTKSNNYRVIDIWYFWWYLHIWIARMFFVIFFVFNFLTLLTVDGEAFFSPMASSKVPMFWKQTYIFTLRNSARFKPQRQRNVQSLGLLIPYLWMWLVSALWFWLLPVSCHKVGKRATPELKWLNYHWMRRGRANGRPSTQLASLVKPGHLVFFA